MAKNKGHATLPQQPIGAITDLTARGATNMKGKETNAASTKDADAVPLHWEERDSGNNLPPSTNADPTNPKRSTNAATNKPNREPEGVAIDCPYKPEQGYPYPTTIEHLDPQSQHVLLQKGCEPFDPLTAGAAILELLNNQVLGNENKAAAAPELKTYQAALGIDRDLRTTVQSSAASSSGCDRFQTDILRSMHPLRNEIAGPSDDICINSEHSSVKGVNHSRNIASPWMANAGFFSEPIKPLKVDLILPQTSAHIENNILYLDETDYTPLSIGWGFSLLGFFAGRFPGKAAIGNLTQRWKFPLRVSYHPKGWIVFRFEKEEHANSVLASGPYSIFGIHLVLFHMPSEFRFDSSPELHFKVWATLPNLPLELWNASAISKIASVVGTPIEVDSRTISKHHIAGPRVLIMVDAKKEPPESITLKLHNGTSFSQLIHLDYYPFFCTRCRRAGHLASACRTPLPTDPGTRPPPRNRIVQSVDDDGWQKVQNRKKRETSRSRSRQPQHRSRSRGPNRIPRSKSRQPEQRWQPKAHTHLAPVSVQNMGTPQAKTLNTHIRFESPTSSSQNAPLGNKEGIETSNQFQPFDDFDDLEEAMNDHFTEGAAATTPPPTSPFALKTPPEDRHSATLTLQSGAAPSPRNIVHQRLNSDDTFSTECIVADSQPRINRRRSFSADSRPKNSEKGDQPLSFADYIQPMEDDTTSTLHQRGGEKPPKNNEVPTNSIPLDDYAATNTFTGKEDASKNLNEAMRQYITRNNSKKAKDSTYIPPNNTKGRVPNKTNAPRK